MADLAGDALVGLGVVLDGEDVVGVCVVVVGDVLGFVVDEASSEELLGVGVGVVDDAESGTLPDVVAVGGQVEVVPGVVCFVPVHVVHPVLLIWLLVIWLIV